jgi:ribosomal protein S11
MLSRPLGVDFPDTRRVVALKSKGTCRRGRVAVFKNVYAFGRNFLYKNKKMRKVPLRLVVCGAVRHAYDGLLRAGFRFSLVQDGRHPPFNGCRRKKRR